MSQPRILSLAEAAANVLAGFGLALLVQLTLFPVVGISVTAREHMKIALVFAGVSLVRGYLLRRLFERFGRRA